MGIADAIIRLAMKTPYRHLPNYMNRYWLIPYSRFPLAARVHQILRSDDDRAFHDHPWAYVTIILKGGYTEVRPIFDESGLFIGESREWRGAGSILYRPAKSWHRLEIAEGVDTWTLFITGRKVQQWGFLETPKHKIEWREFLNDWTTKGTPGT